MKENGDIVNFLRKKDYVMVNNYLGAGSFGRTVLLKDPDIDELFVAKKYEPWDESDNVVFYNSFLQEIKIMYKLNHKNVVRIYNYYLHPEIYTGYIIMEYIDGKNIEEYFNNYFPFTEEKIPTPDDIFAQLIDAFVYIESKGILHRDIREGNILIDRDGTVKIIDFGLGKTFFPVYTSKDSKVNNINRYGLDKLPIEKSMGRYTTKTDMFYLAELVHRLLNKNDLLSFFSYNHILEKMMEFQENQRYSSFKEIRDIMNKKDFYSLTISESDKHIYQNFSNSLYSCIHSFLPNKEFVQNVGEFKDRLKYVIRENCFEDTVQNNGDLIGTIVKRGYNINKKVHILCDHLIAFLEWLENQTEGSQNLVFNNILSKLSTITTDYDDELPF